MAYTYGVSPVTGLPIPLDGTPLDGVSWGHQIDAAGARTIFPCASQAEQDDYLSRVAAAGLGPSSTQPITVRRTDLDGLVMTHDGVGFHRDTGGSLRINGYANAATTEGAGTTSTRGAVSFTLPCSADIFVSGIVTGLPPEAPANWAFSVWLEDQTGREVSPRIVYANLPRIPYTAEVQAVFSMPEGSGQVRLRTNVNSLSGPITWAHVNIAGHYA